MNFSLHTLLKLIKGMKKFRFYGYIYELSLERAASLQWLHPVFDDHSNTFPLN